MIQFFDKYEYLISLLVGIIGLTLSAFGVYYGRKAYRVAQDIFDDGLQIQKQEVLSHLSVEIITEFINPLNKFKISTNSLWTNTYDTQNVFTVRDILKDNAFSVEFPYFDIHKGDIWDSLTVCGEAEQGKAFNDILNFVNKAKRFGDAVNNLCRALDECLEDIKEISHNTTLNDLFEKCKNSNKKYYLNKNIFDRGREMIKEISDYVEKLPKELEISEMQRSIYIN